MSESSDHSNPWVPVVFEDRSRSYTLGFEAGLLWSVLAGPVKSVDERIEHLVLAGNRVTFERMAKATGWAAFFAGTDDPKWMTATFTRAKPQLSLVRGET